MRYLLLSMIVLLLAACAQSNELYYYGNSSQSYYRAVKYGDDNSRLDYKNSLNKVFEKSAARGLKVPPGLYCDYAMLLLKEGQLAEAKVYMDKEKAAWPESGPMVDLLLQRYFQPGK